MKRMIMLFGILFIAGMIGTVSAEDSSSPMEQMSSTQHMMHHSMMDMEGSADNRISLHLSSQQKQHQLANMRSHLEAVRNIIGLLANSEFEKASLIAHNKLGLTPEMKKMCSMFDNEDFRKTGLAFHQSADELGDVLQSGDLKRSLSALHRTMNSCVQCHAAFRQ